MLTFEEFLFERGYGGLAYEDKVRSAIDIALTTDSDLSNNLEMIPDTAGGFDSTVVDLYMNVGGIKYAFEIKMDKNAQMGGSSLRWDGGTWAFAAKGAKSLEPETQELIINAAKKMEPEYKKFIDYFKSVEPRGFHEENSGIPFKVTKDAWEDAKKKGLLKVTNSVIKFDTTFIHNWYAAKDCYYMQIGKMGLFYLKKNPLKLPIPQLKGDIEIYMRLTRGTAKVRKTGEYAGENTSTVSLRALANLKLKGVKSKYSLDNSADVIKLFSN